MPAQCVWDDEEFSRNGLVLESKFTMRQIIEQHAPSVVPFFTTMLRLQNAGIFELIADLKLMQENGRDDSQRVFRLYERIESYRRQWGREIKQVIKSGCDDIG